MSHFRVLICRVDDLTSDQMTELAPPGGAGRGHRLSSFGTSGQHWSRTRYSSPSTKCSRAGPKQATFSNCAARGSRPSAALVS